MVASVLEEEVSADEICGEIVDDNKGEISALQANLEVEEADKEGELEQNREITYTKEVDLQQNVEETSGFAISEAQAHAAEEHITEGATITARKKVIPQHVSPAEESVEGVEASELDIQEPDQAGA
ncbi:unnamed protein product, partial [Gongylonema pulchrum]|uniref:DUF2382 domain-containing protein n=1 Tax=Gongylonema pulchrum TaxID=637853 RepID=A0A183DFI4_9BILA